MTHMSALEAKVNYFILLKLGISNTIATALVGKSRRIGYYWQDRYLNPQQSGEPAGGAKRQGRPSDPVLADIWCREMDSYLDDHSELPAFGIVHEIEERHPGIGWAMRRSIERLYFKKFHGREADAGSELPVFNPASGIPNDRELRIRIFFFLHGIGFSVEESAHMVGRSRRTGYNWLKKRNSPKRHPVLREGAEPKDNGERRGRRRDPELLEIWQTHVGKFLKQNPNPCGKAVMDEVNRVRPGFGTKKRRSIYRWLREWKSEHGGANGIAFPQEHEPGKEAQIDFTDVDELGVTFAGERVKLLLLIYRLMYSGRIHAEPLIGGESIPALFCGLENAFFSTEGVPEWVRTDSLPAAYRNTNWNDFDDQTWSLRTCSGYWRFKAVRTSRNCPNENGGVESTHRHFIFWLLMALIRRGSRDFKNLGEFQQFVDEQVALRNRFMDRNGELFKKELAALAELRTPLFTGYKVHYPTIDKYGLITINEVKYSVQSRLIQRKRKGRKHKDKRLEVREFYDRLAVFSHGKYVETLPKGLSVKQGGSGYVVNPAHVLPSLIRKKQALLNLKYRDQLLPNEFHRRMFELAMKELEPRKACELSVGLLELATYRDCAGELDSVLSQMLDRERVPDIRHMRNYFERYPKRESLTGKSGIAHCEEEETSTEGPPPQPVQRTFEMSCDGQDAEDLKGMRLRITCDRCIEEERQEAEAGPCVTEHPEIQGKPNVPGLIVPVSPDSRTFPADLLELAQSIGLSHLTAVGALPSDSSLQMNGNLITGNPLCPDLDSLLRETIDIKNWKPEQLDRCMQAANLQGQAIQTPAPLGPNSGGACKRGIIIPGQSGFLASLPPTGSPRNR